MKSYFPNSISSPRHGTRLFFPSYPLGSRFAPQIVSTKFIYLCSLFYKKLRSSNERTLKKTIDMILERVKFKVVLLARVTKISRWWGRWQQTKGTTVERIEKMKIYALFELFMRKGYKNLVQIINILRIVRRISALSFDRSSSDVKRYEQIFENVLFFPLYNISFFDIGLFPSRFFSREKKKERKEEKEEDRN